MLLQLMDGDAHSARALATAAGIAPSIVSSHLRRLQPDPPSGPLLRARACYGHVGGQLCVDVAALLREDGVIDDLAPGESGRVRTFDHPLLTALAITELPDARPGVRVCLDWSHGTVHLAGALGAALFTAFLAEGWIRRLPGGRASRITEPGRRRVR